MVTTHQSGTLFRVETVIPIPSTEVIIIILIGSIVIVRILENRVTRNVVGISLTRESRELHDIKGEENIFSIKSGGAPTSQSFRIF